MNGVMVNHINLPKNEPCLLNHMDVIEFGGGSKFLYSFRVSAQDGPAASDGDHAQPPPAKVANRSRLSLGNRNFPSAKESPAAYKSWLQSKKGLERTLLEESVIIEEELEKQTSRKSMLLVEQQKLKEESELQKQELLTQFAQEKKELEERVQRGEVEKTELQKENQALEDRMNESLKQFQVSPKMLPVSIDFKICRPHARCYIRTNVLARLLRWSNFWKKLTGRNKLYWIRKNASFNS